jgi:predicted ribosome quality control (RQC) complex YloA/Tae2 family protein
MLPQINPCMYKPSVLPDKIICIFYNDLNIRLYYIYHMSSEDIPQKNDTTEGSTSLVEEVVNAVVTDLASTILNTHETPLKHHSSTPTLDDLDSSIPTPSVVSQPAEEQVSSQFIEPSVEETAEKIEQVLEQTAEKIEQVLEQTAEKIEQVTDVVQETTEKIEEMVEVVQETAEKIEQVVAAVTNEAAKQMETAIDSVIEEATKQIETAIESVAEQATKQIESVIESVAEEATKQIESAIASVTEEATPLINDIVSNLEINVEDNSSQPPQPQTQQQEKTTGLKRIINIICACIQAKAKYTHVPSR